MRVYHNPRCSKSRDTIKILKERNVSFETIEYLKNPLSVDELRDVCTLLAISPKELLRTKELVYEELVKEQGLPSDEQALAWMNQHPKLMERPIVICGIKAVVARPAEKVLSLL